MSVKVFNYNGETNYHFPCGVMYVNKVLIALFITFTYHFSGHL